MFTGKFTEEQLKAIVKKVAGNFVKKRPKHRCFPVNFAERFQKATSSVAQKVLQLLNHFNFADINLPRNHRNNFALED